MSVSLQNSMLDLIHESHLRLEKCKSRARHLLHWPRMTLDIEDIVSNCVVCCKYKRAHSKEPMFSHAIPPEPFLGLVSTKNFPNFPICRNSTAKIIGNSQKIFRWSRYAPPKYSNKNFDNFRCGISADWKI